MSPELWQRVADIAGEALEKPVEERGPFVRTQCGDDQELLQAVLEMLSANEEMGEFLEAPVDAGENPLVQDGFGPYRVIREIGHGGMSLVYLGERVESGFTQQVAIKVILHKSPGVLQESETRILAKLEHPNIARFLDAGVTRSGLRYLVMEYVDGVPCTEYARNLPDEKARLRLFLQICAGVQYANRSLIVHRDLKPGNVIVNREGLPKLLDFGIAKILDADTASPHTVGTRAYTPDYASPEQILGEPITTATDVYSLGVLLCEMVAGRRPRAMVELPMAEMIRVARTEVTEVPFQGDLGAIARKALRCDPSQRYESAAELARDIERYIEGRPITARDPSWTYAAGKFIARNRITVTATTAAVLALCVAGGVALWQARVASLRFQMVRSLANSVLFELHDSIEKLPGSLESRQLLVKRSLEYLDTLAQDATASDVDLQIEVAKGYLRLGDIENSYSLGQPIAAQKHYEKSLALTRALVSSHPRNFDARRQMFLALDSASSGYESQGQYEKAIPLAEEAKRFASETLEMFPQQPEAKRDRLRSIYGLAFTWNRSRTHKEKAVAEGEVALAGWRELVRADPNDMIALEELSKAERLLGGHYFETQKYEASLQHTKAAYEMDKLLASKSSGKEERVAFSLGQLAVIQSLLNNRDEALRMLTEQLEIRRKLMERDPANLDALRRYGITLNRICDTYVRMRNAEEAIRFGEQAAAVQRKVYAKDPHSVLVNREYLYALVDLAHGYGIRKQKEKYCPLVREAEPLLHGPLEKTAETVADRTRKDDVRKTLPRCAS